MSRGVGWIMGGKHTFVSYFVGVLFIKICVCCILLVILKCDYSKQKETNDITKLGTLLGCNVGTVLGAIVGAIKHFVCFVLVFCFLFCTHTHTHTHTHMKVPLTLTLTRNH